MRVSIGAADRTELRCDAGGTAVVSAEGDSRLFNLDATGNQQPAYYPCSRVCSVLAKWALHPIGRYL